MNAKRLVIGLAALLLAVLMIVAIAELRRREKSIQNSAGGAATTQGTTLSTAPVTSTTTKPQDPDTVPAYSVCVSTIYGDLYYQDQWMDFMVVEQTPGADALTVMFQAKLNEQTFDLFVLTIGEHTGSPVGQITDASGVKREVYVQLCDLGDISHLSAGEQNRLYAMQEEINFVIENMT